MRTVVLYGESGVGKTRWLAGHLGLDYVPTFGYNVVEEQVQVRGTTHRVRWVDTSGDARWLESQPWFPRVDLVIVAFSPQQRESWARVPSWIARANAWHTGNHERLLVGLHQLSSGSSVRTPTILSMATLCAMTYIDIPRNAPPRALGLAAVVRALCCGAHERRSVTARFAAGAAVEDDEASPPLGWCACGAR